VKPVLSPNRFGIIQNSNASNAKFPLLFGMRKRKSVKAATKLIPIGM